MAQNSMCATVFATAAERVYVDEMIYGSISISSSEALIVLRDCSRESLNRHHVFSQHVSESTMCFTSTLLLYTWLPRLARYGIRRLGKNSLSVGSERVSAASEHFNNFRLPEKRPPPVSLRA